MDWKSAWNRHASHGPFMQCLDERENHKRHTEQMGNARRCRRRRRHWYHDLRRQHSATGRSTVLHRLAFPIDECARSSVSGHRRKFRFRPTHQAAKAYIPAVIEKKTPASIV